MIENAQALIADFEAALGAALGSRVSHEPQLAPHRGHKLPKGMCAVYVFSLSKNYGGHVPAGRNRVLKVGKAGCNSNARFQSQHYNPSSAPSNVAHSLLEAKIFWPYLGIVEMSEASVRSWIEQNTDRDNFYLSATDASHLGRLEIYLRGRLGPVFEGG
jgi:hypothetical protein